MNIKDLLVNYACSYSEALEEFKELEKSTNAKPLDRFGISFDQFLVFQLVDLRKSFDIRLEKAHSEAAEYMEERNFAYEKLDRIRAEVEKVLEDKKTYPVLTAMPVADSVQKILTILSTERE